MTAAVTRKLEYHIVYGTVFGNAINDTDTRPPRLPRPLWLQPINTLDSLYCTFENVLSVSDRTAILPP